MADAAQTGFASTVARSAWPTKRACSRLRVGVPDGASEGEAVGGAIVAVARSVGRGVLVARGVTAAPWTVTVAAALTAAGVAAYSFTTSVAAPLPTTTTREGVPPGDRGPAWSFDWSDDTIPATSKARSSATWA